MFDVRTLYNALKCLREKNKALHTNCFFLLPKMKRIASLPGAEIEIGKNWIWLLYKERDFQRLYFWAAGLPDITEICRSVRQKKESGQIVMELVGREPDINRAAGCFAGEGMEIYAVQSRYKASALHTVPEKEANCTCSLISAADAEKVLPLLEEQMDPYVSHLPPVPYIYELQRKNMIYGCYMDGELVGVEILEPVGIWGRYWYQVVIKKEAQRKGLFTILKNYMILHNLQCRHWSTWITDTNIGSIRANEKTGMRKDGLKNIVMIYSGDRKQ